MPQIQNVEKIMWRQLWQLFLDWFMEPMPFPRDHWYRRETPIVRREIDREGDPAIPESRAEELVEGKSPPIHWTRLRS